MIDILKASAGSGKTYRLSGEYVDILLSAERERPYRNVLAVTFTNKATAEMKDRILKQLQKRASDPEYPYRKKSEEYLLEILHDYTAFSVSTIDAFFQQTLRAFAREVGQFGGYEINLDRELLINEAMDRLLDSLAPEQTELVSWMRDNAMEQISRGEKVDVSSSLYKIGKLYKESEITDTAQYDKKTLAKTRKECWQIIRDFEARYKRNLYMINTDSLSKTALRSLNTIKCKFEKTGELAVPTAANLCNEISGTDFSNLFYSPCGAWSDEYKSYNTALIVKDLIYGLGVIREFDKQYNNLLTEKGVLSLDDSDKLLQKIIDGSDAPFIYEKIGVKYFNYLLDEFQDTSTIQWGNMQPLLDQSNAWGQHSLVVGDVKQSIYRWRKGDWRLLGYKLKQHFGEQAEEIPMRENWRSAKTILDFCNGFFTRVRDSLGLEKDIFDGFDPSKKSGETQTGFVRVEFCEGNAQLQKVLESIMDARSSGANWADITVLVQTNSQGTSVADFLVKNDIPVVSNDSLYVSSSLIVRKLVDRLSDAGEYGTYHSLVDLCEEHLRGLKLEYPDSYAGETLFIQAFMDDLLNWTKTNGNNLLYYLKYYRNKKIAISTPEQSDAVEVMTIHKSKGLESPYIIFPFVNKVEFCKYEPPHEVICWCDYKGVKYPVKMKKNMEHTFFDKESAKENRSQLIDNFNLMYVALTRAEKSLHLISAELTTAGKQRAESGMGLHCSNFAELLYAYCNKSSDYKLGEPFDFNLARQIEERKEFDTQTPQRALPFSAIYESIPLGGRLKPSREAFDFFSDNGAVPDSESPRRKGIVLHSILSDVSSSDDLYAAVENAVLAGSISSEEAKDYEAFLEERIKRHPQWFDIASDSRNEISIIGEDGEFHRPDRVIADSQGNITVIDYKFGVKTSRYREQVKKYMQLYKGMGYRNVKGFLWYVNEDETIAI